MKNKNLLGWIVLLGPMFVVVSLTLFEAPAWIKQQSSEGARYEASVHNDLGRSAMKNGRHREAIAQFKTALKIDPEYTEAYMNLGIAYHLLGDAKQAIAYMKKTMELDPTRKESIYNNMGMVYGKQGDYQKALEMFRNALALNRKSAAIYRNIGEIALVHEDWSTALEAWTGAVDNRPTLSNIYESMKQDALRLYEDEDNFDQIKAVLNEPLTEAVLAKYDARIVDELAWQDPKLADDYMNLGRTSTELGRFDEAVESYLNALKITPGDHVLRNRLGIVYARNDELTKAAEQFELALQLKPNFDDARQNLERCRGRLGGSE